jgi:hypothetical protein
MWSGLKDSAALPAGRAKPPDSSVSPFEPPVASGVGNTVHRHSNRGTRRLEQFSGLLDRIIDGEDRRAPRYRRWQSGESQGFDGGVEVWAGAEGVAGGEPAGAFGAGPSWLWHAFRRAL